MKISQSRPLPGLPTGPQDEPDDLPTCEECGGVPQATKFRAVDGPVGWVCSCGKRYGTEEEE